MRRGECVYPEAQVGMGLTRSCGVYHEEGKCEEVIEKERKQGGMDGWMEGIMKEKE